MTNHREYWQRFLKKMSLDGDLEYNSCFHFELTEQLANELLELVLSGKKKATASSLFSFSLTGDKLPTPGDFSIITDWKGEPRCVIQTRAVTIMPFKDLTYDIVRREGEDDNLESWRRGHRRFFCDEGAEMGYQFSEDMLIVFEDFEVVYI